MAFFDEKLKRKCAQRLVTALSKRKRSAPIDGRGRPLVRGVALMGRHDNFGALTRPK